ncbi:mitochondrial ATP-independent inner membrane protease subunit 1a-like [Apium graveolens]|uniref:mitochondrial ATP-independent inner membrane protease subunit 1a-like n=1 Tax=Apium graveolens TaxID=4045 RepID=UPI003D7BFE3A
MNTKLWSNIVKEALDKTLLVGKFFCALHVTNTYLFTPAYVFGPSMLPTFNISGDFVLAEKISPRFGKVCLNDVVLIRSPEDPRKIVTKRIVGMEGDNVTYSINPESDDSFKTVVVPKGHVWIEGDNKYMSRDSKDFGPVPYGMIVGRIFWKVLPFESFGSAVKKRIV